MTSVPERPDADAAATDAPFRIVVPPFDEMSDEAKDALLGCYRLMLDIAAREGIEVDGSAEQQAEGER